jgi:hypothetical protein
MRMSTAARKGSWNGALQYALCALFLAGFIVWCDVRAPGSNRWILVAGTIVAAIGWFELVRLAAAAWRSPDLPERWRWVSRLPRGFARDPIGFIILPAGAVMMAVSIVAQFV